MLLSRPRDIIRAFSEGRISWRDACNRLQIDDYAALDALRMAYGFPRYEGDAALTQAKIDSIDTLLYADRVQASVDETP